MTPTTPQDRLREYEHFNRHSASHDPLFGVVLALCIALSLGAGLYFRQVPEPVEEITTQSMERIRARFIAAQPTPPPKPAVRTPPKPKETPRVEEAVKPDVPEKPIDLTKGDVVLGQKVDDIRASTSTPVRRVYGLRKVYSQGIGAGGSMADAVIGKLGNTLAKDFDTLTASPKEIKGEIASVTTLTSMPRILKPVKPEYTKEMIENKIEGAIRLKVMVDIDGRIKKAVALNDLGYGSAQRAIDACYAMEFEPARRGEQPVATEIIISIKFVLLG